MAAKENRYNKTIKMKRTIIILASALAMLPLSGQAQQVLTLDDCRQMALDNSNALKTARQKVEIAGYDRKIAAANYFPKITASGTYMYANKDLQLISDEATTELTSAGTILQKDLNDKLGAILSDPVILQKVMTDPALQKLLGYAKGMDIATPINAIGGQISQALTLDTRNTTAAVIQQESIPSSWAFCASSGKERRIAGAKCGPVRIPT